MERGRERGVCKEKEGKEGQFLSIWLGQGGVYFVRNPDKSLQCFLPLRGSSQSWNNSSLT